MSAYAAVALYPLWSLAMLVGLTALRLGRLTGRGLFLLCMSLALWVTALILFNHPSTRAFSERLVPAGMFVAAACVHAGADLSGLRRFPVVWATYVYAALIAVLGVVTPSLYYGPGMSGPGPLFWPLTVLSGLVTASIVAWFGWNAWRSQGRLRRAWAALSAGSLFGSIGGGGAVAAHTLGLGPLELAGPPLFLCVLLMSYAVLGSQDGASRRLITQGLVYALITAALSAVGLVSFFAVLPWLTPSAVNGSGRPWAWLVFVTFFAALPLDGLRILVVENVGRRLSRDPIGVPDLIDAVHRSEARADHARRLAEIGTMASAVAHEIRNPLGIIMAQARLLERSGAREDSIDAIRAQITRAERFLRDLLRYSRPRPLELEELPLNLALEQVVGNVRQALPGPIPPILIDVEGGAALTLELDRGAFDDILTVLLSNAVAALEGREDGKIRVSARQAGERIEVAVEDNGPGVPPEIAETVFQPFVTGRGRDAKYPGTGLGLAIASGWAERHGGEIRLEAADGGGARFVVSLPRERGVQYG